MVNNWNVSHREKTQWNDIVSTMDFYSIYHSYEWGEIKRQDGWQVLRLEKGDDSAGTSLAQIFYKQLPLGIFFLWCPGGVIGHDKIVPLPVLKSVLKARIVYFRSSFHDGSLQDEFLLSCGWKRPSFYLNSNRSMNLSLDRDLEEIKQQLSTNWRHNLKRSLKKGVKIEVWKNPDPQTLEQYYLEFEKMKGLDRQHSFEAIKGAIEQFKDSLVILKAESEDGKFLGLRGYVHLGKRALDWFAISSESGRLLYASYGLFWSIIEDMKSKNIKSYDLSGVDPENNPGVYNFKKGTGAEMVSYPGEFEICNNVLVSKIMNYTMKRKYGK